MRGQWVVFFLITFPSRIFITIFICNTVALMSWTQCVNLYVFLSIMHPRMGLTKEYLRCVIALSSHTLHQVQFFCNHTFYSLYQECEYERHALDIQMQAPWESQILLFSCDQAALQMVFSVCLSVCPSVCPSAVTPFWLCSHHRIIMKFSGVITSDKSDVHAKGPGRRSKVKVTEVTIQLYRYRTLTPVWTHVWWWNDAYSLIMPGKGALLFFKDICQNSRSHGSKNRRVWPRLGVSGLYLQFEFTNGYKMLHKAWNSIEGVPYCFWRSPVKFQGHAALKIVEFDPSWAFPDCNSSLKAPMATKWCTKLEVAYKRCPIVFQGHTSNCKVTRLKKSMIWPKLGVSGL